MKAIVVTDRAAGTAGMKLVERPEPDAARLASLEGANYGDVVVEVHASGFTGNELEWPSTWIDRLGRDRTPSIPGHEVAGVVTALSYGATGLSVGQRVFGLTDWTRDGTLAEYAVVEARNLAPLPGDVDFTVGAGVAMTGLTAWQGLFEHGRLQAGQSVLVHGAAGAVGSMATQLAREAGAYVIGTGRAAHRQTALDFGAQEFVDLDNDALEDVGGVDLVFDVFGGDIGKRSAGLVRAGGTLVTVAGPPEARPADGLAIDFVVVSDRAQLGEIAQRVRDGRLRTNIGTRRDPRRCRRRLQPDRAGQGEDDHPRSSVRTQPQGQLPSFPTPIPHARSQVPCGKPVRTRRPSCEYPPRHDQTGFPEQLMETKLVVNHRGVLLPQPRHRGHQGHDAEGRHRRHPVQGAIAAARPDRGPRHRRHRPAELGRLPARPAHLTDSGYDGAGRASRTDQAAHRRAGPRSRQPGLQHPAALDPLPRRTRLRPAHRPLASPPTRHQSPG